MKVRVCAQTGCPALQAEPRCPAHRREHEQARGSRQERGYDAEYDARRKADVARMARGEVLTCWRCDLVVMPHDYSLGHCDDDRSVIHGPEHLRQCNLANTRGDCPHDSHISPDA